MSANSVDLSCHHPSDEHSRRIVEKIEALIEYMAMAGKTPNKVDIFPGDHRHVVRSLNSGYRRQAKEQDRLESEHRKASGLPGGKVKSEPRKAGDICFRGIPVVPGQGYSKPRKVQA